MTPTAGESLAGLGVMVVEDSFLLAMEVATILRAAGAEVVGPFGAAEDALAALARRAPDAAVLDVDLGVGDSLDVARALRAAGVPFLFLTGFGSSALPAEFAATERLEKPVEGGGLARALLRCRAAAAGRAKEGA